jgi:Family of unknown function (DUF5941)
MSRTLPGRVSYSGVRQSLGYFECQSNYKALEVVTMTVALVLAAEADAGMCGQLVALGVRRVDLAGSASGLLTVAAAARVAGERVLICAGQGAVPGEVLARLLSADRTAVFTGGTGLGVKTAEEAEQDPAALVVDTADLAALAEAAEFVAACPAEPDPFGTLLLELSRRGVSARVLDAGPDGDGLVAQLLADPLADRAAQFAAGRRLTPASLAGISAGFGLIAVAWFTQAPATAKLIAVAALFVSFAVGRAGSVVAASGRPSRAYDWLGTAVALVTEFAVYAALAISAGPDGDVTGLFGAGTFADWGGPGQQGVWRLAMTAMGLLGVRRLIDLCYDRAASLPDPAMRKLEQALTLPAGERFAALAVADVLWGPRVALLVLLGWGAVAAAYVLTGRIVGSAVLSAMVDVPENPASDGADPRRVAGLGRRHHAVGPGISDVPAYRDDGVLARYIGGWVKGAVPPLLPVVVGLLVNCALAAFGMENLGGLLILTPVAALLLAAVGTHHPHDGRGDWLAPGLLLTGEYVFIAALGLADGVWPAVIYGLLAAVVLRHIDIAYRARHGAGLSVDVYGQGWEGRMLLLGLAASVSVADAVPVAYAVLSGYLWVLFGWDFLGGWLVHSHSGGGVDRHGARGRRWPAAAA